MLWLRRGGEGCCMHGPPTPHPSAAVRGWHVHVLLCMPVFSALKNLDSNMGEIGVGVSLDAGQSWDTLPQQPAWQIGRAGVRGWNVDKVVSS